jgi:hypothetical protein
VFSSGVARRVTGGGWSSLLELFAKAATNQA